MTDPAAGQEHRSTPAVPAEESGSWLRGHLLETASALYPDRPPVVVREWTDPVRLRDPAPVGHRFLSLMAVGGDDRRPSSPGLQGLLDAFAAAGWTVRRQAPCGPGENEATARRGPFRARLYEGAGPGILTVTGWTPVVFPEEHLAQPHFTLSTVDVDTDGVLCDDCHGWGMCLLCEGRPYSGGSGGYGRCWCAANNAGPGNCVECAGRGSLPAEAMSWKRKEYGLPEADDGDTARRPPAENGHDSNTHAFTDISHRSCACGEFRCFWRNTVSEADGRLLSRFVGRCQGCAARRAYAFTLPRR
ncbi:hypothetical protein [Streptomyces caatingaensis]|uniref:hypothetical protein n=1 Tax=Streptomyces caatingaensis TaxID=1678637 RepID=UPI00069D6C0F|nr:hypothetical protein [Streptomyces caatingaensis]